MSKKIKFAVSVIFLIFIPICGLIFSADLPARYGFSYWQLSALIFLTILTAIIIFSLVVDLTVVFPLKNFRAQFIKKWRESNNVKIPENAPAEIKELTDTFNLILDEVEKKTSSLKESKKLDDLKYEFITIASHQLRTPLTEVKWSLDILEHSDQVKNDEKLKEIMVNAREEVKNVINMTNQLLSVLQMSTIEKMKRASAIYIPELINDLIKKCKSEINRCPSINVENDFGVIPTITGDIELIRFVFDNLITNAINYGFEEKPVTIRLKSLKREIAISVEDEGAPISESERVMIFEKFFRGAEAKRTRPDGWGLALYLVRKIVEWHGGTIVCESVPPNRTVFTVKLPIEAHGEIQKFITNY